MHHLWPTYGVREGMRTIQGEHPAVCFTGFNLADLIAARDGFTPQNAAATQYAITFPITAALKGVFNRSFNGRAAWLACWMGL